MRHLKSGRKFSRTSSHRTALFRNMAASLIQYEQIRTTLPKAKELRRVAEPLITMAKEPTLANRRLAFARLRDRTAVTKLFDELGPRFKDRAGGYLRILKFGHRAGDTAPMAVVQLLDRPEKPAAGDTAPAVADAPVESKPKTKSKAKPSAKSKAKSKAASKAA